MFEWLQQSGCGHWDVLLAIFVENHKNMLSQKK